MSKKKNKGKVYNRGLVRTILRSQLKTNKIRDSFHDKEWLRVYFNTL